MFIFEQLFYLGAVTGLSKTFFQYLEKPEKNSSEKKPIGMLNYALNLFHGLFQHLS